MTPSLLKRGGGPRSSSSSKAAARSLCKGYSFGESQGGVKVDDTTALDFDLSSPSAALVKRQPTADSSTTEACSSVASDAAAADAADLPGDERLLLGGEDSKYDRQDELDGVRYIWNELDKVERSELPDLAMMVRHWRAESGDAEKALAKLRDTLHWRREFGVDDLVGCFEGGDSGGGNGESTANNKLAATMEEENSTGKIYVRGYDREGRAFMYMRPGRENTMNAADNMKHLVWNIEKAVACTKRKSLEILSSRRKQQQQQVPSDAAGADQQMPLEKINLVIDYAGFRLRDAPPLSTSKHTLDILQKHYPERMHRAYVLHPPLYFKTFWSVIKPFVDPLTKKKIVMVSNDAAMRELTDAVGPANLNKMEPVAGGPEPVRDFDSREYLHLPFDHCFDE